MHSVNRGREPKELKAIRRKYTPGWVNYYRKKKGKEPTDDHWRGFKPTLSQRFSGLCGYCEEICNGEVDHFRPKSQFPERVYWWSNWIFACHDCNHTKSARPWQGGYVDPCSTSAQESPEDFFDFDTMTGEILPKEGLTQAKREKAERTIADLRLNDRHHILKRLGRLWIVSQYLSSHNPNDPNYREFILAITARDKELSSITRAMIVEQGYSWEE